MGAWTWPRSQMTCTDYTRAALLQRDLQAENAKASGEADLAKSIKQLRRPTTSAWLANLLVRRRPDEIDRLLALGDDMRRAQSNLEAKEMRALADDRRKLVTDLAKDVRILAREQEKEVNESSVQELQATLEAAVSDPAASESLRSGNLTKPLEYSGFGPVDLTDAVAIPLGDRPPPKTKAPTKASPSDGKSKSRPPSAAAERRETKRHQAELAMRDPRVAHAKAEQSARIEAERMNRSNGELNRLTGQIEKLEKQISLLQNKADQAARAIEESKKSLEELSRSERAAARRLRGARAALDRI